MKFITIIASTIAACLLTACGASSPSPQSSQTTGIASQDLVTAQMRRLFAEGTPVNGAAALRMNRVYTCAYQWGVQDRFYSGSMTIKFSDVAGFLTSELIFGDAFTINATFINRGGAYVSQVPSIPTYTPTRPLEVFARSTSMQQLVLEWTLGENEWMSESDPSGLSSSHTYRLGLYTDPSVADPARNTLMYSVCQG